MQVLTRQRWFPYALIVVTLVAVGAVFFIVARRGGSEIDPAIRAKLRTQLQAEVAGELAELLQVSEAKAQSLYDQKELEEAGAEEGIDEQEILAAAEQAAEVVLDQAITNGEISEEQAVKARQIVVKTVQRHL